MAGTVLLQHTPQVRVASNSRREAPRAAGTPSAARTAAVGYRVTLGRLIFCTECGARVEVHEPQGEYIDPDRYVCGDCQIALTVEANPRALDGWAGAVGVYGVIQF